MDKHEELKDKLNEAMDRQGAEEFNLGSMTVERELTGQLVVNENGNLFAIDRMPPDVYGRMMQAVERYNELSTDGGLH